MKMIFHQRKLNVMKVFTVEVYCDYSDEKPAWNLHEGNFESNRDCLSPQMYWAQDFYAVDVKQASAKVERMLNYFEKHNFPLKDGTKAKATLGWPMI